jgi:tetratricopeptide (TPR) repeat protein
MTPQSRFLCAAVVACCTSCGFDLEAAIGSDSRDWKRLRADGFTVVGSASASELRKVRDEIQLFRDGLRALFPSLRLDGPVPMDVIVFKDDRAFTPFKPRARGKPLDGVAGYFSPQADRALIVMAPASGDFAYQLIFHEYTHYIVHLNMRRVPLWLHEGLAEFYSTFRGSSYGDRSQIGRPVGHRVRVLHDLTLLPLRKLLGPDHQDLFRDPWGAAVFYSQSWAFVHYLMLGDNGAHRAQLKAYLAGQSSGGTLDERFARAFGMPLEQVDRELAAYVQRFSWPVAEVKPTRVETAPAPVERVPEVEALSQEAHLLVSHGALDEADVLLDRAEAIDGAHVATRLTRARSLIARERHAEALEVLGGTPGPDAHFGTELTRGEAFLALEQPEQAIAAYSRAVTVQPASPAGYFGLSLALRAQGRPEAAAAFERCLAIDPAPGWYSARLFATLRMGLDADVAEDAASYLRESAPEEGRRAYVALAASLALIRRDEREEANRLLDAALTPLDDKQWPARVITFVRGHTTAADLLARASGPGELTEAHAYVGVLASIAGKEDEARTHLEWVTGKGLKTYLEYGLAVGELKRLARTQPIGKRTSSVP